MEGGDLSFGGNMGVEAEFNRMYYFGVRCKIQRNIIGPRPCKQEIISLKDNVSSEISSETTERKQCASS
jgi:hypothetical protein